MAGRGASERGTGTRNQAQPAPKTTMAKRAGWFDAGKTSGLDPRFQSMVRGRKKVKRRRGECGGEICWHLVLVALSSLRLVSLFQDKADGGRNVFAQFRTVGAGLPVGALQGHWPVQPLCGDTSSCAATRSRQERGPAPGDMQRRYYCARRAAGGRCCQGLRAVGLPTAQRRLCGPARRRCTCTFAPALELLLGAAHLPIRTYSVREHCSRVTSPRSDAALRVGESGAGRLVRSTPCASHLAAARCVPERASCHGNAGASGMGTPLPGHLADCTGPSKHVLAQPTFVGRWSLEPSRQLRCTCALQLRSPRRRRASRQHGPYITYSVNALFVRSTLYYVGTYMYVIRHANYSARRRRRPRQCVRPHSGAGHKCSYLQLGRECRETRDRAAGGQWTRAGHGHAAILPGRPSRRSCYRSAGLIDMCRAAVALAHRRCQPCSLADQARRQRRQRQIPPPLRPPSPSC